MNMPILDEINMDAIYPEEFRMFLEQLLQIVQQSNIDYVTELKIPIYDKSMPILTYIPKNTAYKAFDAICVMFEMVARNMMPMEMWPLPEWVKALVIKKASVELFWLFVLPRHMFIKLSLNKYKLDLCYDEITDMLICAGEPSQFSLH